MNDCIIYEPTILIQNNNCCRVCGIQKHKKDFRKIWRLRALKLPMKVMCKDCQKLWGLSRSMPLREPEFIIHLD